MNIIDFFDDIQMTHVNCMIVITPYFVKICSSCLPCFKCKLVQQPFLSVVVSKIVSTSLNDLTAGIIRWLSEAEVNGLHLNSFLHFLRGMFLEISKDVRYPVPFFCFYNQMNVVTHYKPSIYF